MFQFTHPGGVRLCTSILPSDQLAVSIHAPGRGATPLPTHYPDSINSFNSRTREGCDSHFVPVPHLGNNVSIHAPGRGATVWCKVAYYGADKQA